MPRAPRPSPAQQQAEALTDVRRIGGELRGALDEQGIEITTSHCEHAVMRLLRHDVIRVGARPAEIDAPIPGQTTIEEQFSEH